MIVFIRQTLGDGGFLKGINVYVDHNAWHPLVAPGNLTRRSGFDQAFSDLFMEHDTKSLEKIYKPLLIK